MFWYPSMGELFFVNLENGGLLRGERIICKKADEFRIKLIDTGEELVFKTIEEFYVMPEKIQELRGIAKKYKWTQNKVIGYDNFDASTFLKDSTYETFNFEIVENKNNQREISVNIWMISNDTNSDEDIEQVTHKMSSLELLNKERDFNEYLPPLPHLFVKYDIMITEFTSINRFYCHFEDINTFYNGKNLTTIRKKLNDKNEIISYQKLKKLPVSGDLIMVKYDDVFYRAKVMEFANEYMCVTILLVDEGKIIENVHLNWLYKFHSRFSDYPFFAIEMEIVDITQRLSNRKMNDVEGINWMIELQKEFHLHVFVM